jgi:hypothetical protein
VLSSDLFPLIIVSALNGIAVYQKYPLEAVLEFYAAVIGIVTVGDERLVRNFVASKRLVPDELLSVSRARVVDVGPRLLAHMLLELGYAEKDRTKLRLMLPVFEAVVEFSKQLAQEWLTAAFCSIRDTYNPTKEEFAQALFSAHNSSLFKEAVSRFAKACNRAGQQGAARR